MMNESAGRSKVAVIGLDGASLPLLNRLANDGVIPNLARLLREGSQAPLTSVIPTNSIAAWSSFMTGKTPDRHGAFSFVVRSPDDFNVKQIVNASFLRGSTLWDQLSSAGKSVGIFNVPLTYPVRPINGFLVSGLMTPSTRTTFTHPPQLTNELMSRFPDYTLDVGWMRYEGRIVDLVDDAVEMTRERVQAARFLFSEFDPDFAMCVFISPDRIQHALWRYIDATHPLYDAEEAHTVLPHIQRFYRAIDEAVGELVDMFGSGTDLLIMSDHGFQNNAKQILLNEWLAREGLLHWSSSSRRWLQQKLQVGKRYIRKRVGKGFASRARKALRQRASFSDETAIDWARTRVYATWETQQGLSVNLRGREPTGVVTLAEYDDVVSEVAALLRAWRDPESGKSIIEQVQLAEGTPFERTGADILIMPAADYAFSRYDSSLYGPTGWASGGHALDGLLIAHGPRISSTASSQTARIIDLAPTILHLMDQPIPEEVSGHVLVDWLDPEFVANHPVRTSDESLAGATAGTTEYSPEDAAEIEKRLRSLGYL